MQKNYRGFFIIAVVAAIAAALIGAFGYNTVAKMVPVVVAARDIKADELPTDKTVAYGKEPAGSLKNDTVREFRELQGMVAKGYIPAGTPLRRSMFQPYSGAGVAARLGTMPSGTVAIAVAPSIDTTVGNATRRGNKVAVKSAAKGAAAQVLAQNAEILDIPDKNSGISAVILAVSSSEAEKIAIARVNEMAVWCELQPSAKEGGGKG